MGQRRKVGIVLIAFALSLAVSARADSPAGFPNAGSDVAGDAHSCAMHADGTLACWGDDAAGQLDGVPEGEFLSVSAGGKHSCGIRADHTLACWGDDSAGQLDNIPSGEFLRVSAGGKHSCAIRLDHTLACWGDDSAGQLDNIPSGWFLSVSAGGAHSCAIRIFFLTLVCWGDDSAGQASGGPAAFYHHHQFGEHHDHDDDYPPMFLAVSAGDTHTCAVEIDRELVCWGDDGAGQLDGIPSGDFLRVSAGGKHSCAIRLDHTLACWGDDSAGQLDGIPSGEFLSVSAGGTHSCAVDTAGGLDCWGDNGHGQVQPSFTSGEPADAVIGTPYTHRFETTPQSPGASFHISAGALPEGLELSGEGELTGSAVVAGDYPVTVVASNGITPDAEQDVTLKVVGSPLLTVDPAEAVTTSAASLSGSIDPRNVPAEAWFEYWPSSSPPQSASQTPAEAISAGLEPQDLSAQISGLSPDTEYSFRLAATNQLAAEPTYSETLSLKTAALPRAAVVLPGLPPPTAGQTINVAPAGGIVGTKCSTDRNFTRLDSAEQIPISCLIDTRRGAIELTASKGTEAGTQSGVFWGGVFAVSQVAEHNWETELKLAGRLKCEKRKGKAAKRRAKSASASSRSYRRGGRSSGRRVWGSGKGNFRTTGNYGSASVRGTTWLVADRCDNSTLFAVREGTVWVRDFVKDTSVVLEAGDRYVAKAAIPFLR